MGTCPFCGIVSGEMDAYVVYENERTMAFFDSNPVVHGHTLVVPKSHTEHLLTGSESTVTAVFRTVRRIAKAMDRVLETDGTSLFYTPGDIVGRITHAHVHVVPRYTDDDIRISLERRRFDEEEAARLAARLRDIL